MTDVKNLHQRLVEAKRIVGETKLKKVDPKKGGGLQYGYLPVSRMKPVVADAEVQAGITRTYGKTRIEDVRDPWDVSNSYGGSTTWYHKMMSLEIILTNADYPEDQLTQTFIGEAKDNSDKVVNKLYTSALKNYFKQIYDIAESEEDDTDSQQEAPVSKIRPPSNDSFFAKRSDVKAPASAPAEPKTEAPKKERAPEKPAATTLDEDLAILRKAESDKMYMPSMKAHLTKCDAESIDDLKEEDVRRIATLYRNVGVKP